MNGRQPAEHLSRRNACAPVSSTFRVTRGDGSSTTAVSTRGRAAQAASVTLRAFQHLTGSGRVNLAWRPGRSGAAIECGSGERHPSGGGPASLIVVARPARLWRGVVPPAGAGDCAVTWGGTSLGSDDEGRVHGPFTPFSGSCPRCDVPRREWQLAWRRRRLFCSAVSGVTRLGGREAEVGENVGVGCRT